MKDAKEKPFALRIEARLVEPLQKLKKNSRRSLNAEINAAIEAWLGRGREEEAKPEEPAPSIKEAVAEKKTSRSKKERKGKEKAAAQSLPDAVVSEPVAAEA